MGQPQRFRNMPRVGQSIEKLRRGFRLGAVNLERGGRRSVDRSAAVHDVASSLRVCQIAERRIDRFEVGMVSHDSDNRDFQRLVESWEIDDVEPSEGDAIKQHGVKLIQELAARNTVDEPARRIEAVGPDVCAYESLESDS